MSEKIINAVKEEEKDQDQMTIHIQEEEIQKEFRVMDLPSLLM
jgi:hypothetical protein